VHNQCWFRGMNLRPDFAKNVSILVLSALLLNAQEPSKSGQAISVTTRLVEVNVVVTDDKGQPVSDLTQEDFTIFEDGKPQKLASFAAHRKLPAGSPSRQAQPLPEGIFSNLAPEDDRGPVIILLVDALNTPLRDQAYAREQLIKYLKTQHQPGQKMAVYALTNTLLLLQDLTTDPEALRAALERRRPHKSVLLEEEDRDDHMAGINPEFLANLERFRQEEVAQRADMRVQLTLAALELLGKAYGGVPGRKNLVWVSGTFPLVLAPDKLTSASVRYYGEELRRTATMLEKTLIAVYPVDARGLTGSALTDASFTGRGTGGRVLYGPTMGDELYYRANVVRDSHAAMHEIADATGGRAYYNRNDIDRAVALATNDGAMYYNLAYYPENKKWNGKFRKIEVRLRRSGLRARHRQGYLAVEMNRSEGNRKDALREIDAALAGPIMHTMVGFYARVVVPPDNPRVENSGGNANASHKAHVRFKVNPQTIFFEDFSDGSRACSLEFVVVAYDKGKIIAQKSETLKGTLKPETYAKLITEGLMLNTELALPTTPSHFRLLVRDNHTGFMGTLDAPYSAAKKIELP
jgi:VWFA-related protein